jgi:hypothetical protein
MDASDVERYGQKVGRRRGVYVVRYEYHGAMHSSVVDYPTRKQAEHVAMAMRIGKWVGVRVERRYR